MTMTIINCCVYEVSYGTIFLGLDDTRLLVSKIAFVLLMFLVTLLFALLPMIVIKNFRRETDPDLRTR